MKKVYLLNDLVFFDPEERSLVSVDATQVRKIILHSPASECLRLLLLHNGQPISQKYLFDEVWEKKGAFVTVNTLYQNMGSIRKGLKAAGLPEDVIKTLPKTGFRISVTLSEVISDAGEAGVVADLALSDKGREKEVAVKKEASPLIVTRVSWGNYFSQVSQYRWLGYIAAILLLVFIWGSILKILPGDTSYYAGYRFAGTINGCDLYSSYPDDEKSIVLFTELMKKHPMQCQSKKITYMAINRMYEASSLLFCDQKITDKDVRCVSFVFISDKNEE